MAMQPAYLLGGLIPVEENGDENDVRLRPVDSSSDLDRITGSAF